MRAYEIHTLQRGEWKMDSVFDDRNLALHEARKADETSRYSGVRVIEENYDEATGQTTTRVIFRGSRADRQMKAKRVAEKPKPERPAPRHSTGKERVRKPTAPTEKKQQSPLVGALVVLLVLATGLAGLALLYHYGNAG